MSPTHEDLSNDTSFSQIKSCVPVPLSKQEYIKGSNINNLQPFPIGFFLKYLITFLFKSNLLIFVLRFIEHYVQRVGNTRNDPEVHAQINQSKKLLSTGHFCYFLELVCGLPQSNWCLFSWLQGGGLLLIFIHNGKFMGEIRTHRLPIHEKKTSWKTRICITIPTPLYIRLTHVGVEDLLTYTALLAKVAYYTCECPVKFSILPVVE